MSILPYKISDAMPKEQITFAADRNFKELERMLSVLQINLNEVTGPIIEGLTEKAILYGLDDEKPILR